MRDLIAGDCQGYLTLFLETGSGLHCAGHIQRDSAGTMIDIKVSSICFPFITDFNDDARKDILCGEFSNVLPDQGTIRAYLNTGTNEQPCFSRYDYVCTGDSQLFIPTAAPVFYDLDMDSLKDLVVGNVTGFVFFYKNFGSVGAPVFRVPYETLQTNNNNFIDALADSRINFVDWDEDGDPDLLIGGQEGYVQLCKNVTGTGVHAGIKNDRLSGGFVVHPNPCRDLICLEYTIEKPTEVGLAIYSSCGQIVRSFNQKMQSPGKHRIEINATHPQLRALTPGIYFAVLCTRTETRTLKILLLRK